MNLKASFVSYLHEKYPELPEAQLNELISENLISPYQISLSHQQLEQIKNEILGYWNLRQWSKNKLTNQFDRFGLKQPKNYAVCMSYDFHINSSGQPELIEVNTNAAFLAMGLELYNFLKLPLPVPTFNENAMVTMFESELALCNAKTNSVAIIDEDPSQQRLFVEFLLFQQILKKNKIHTEIFDYRQIKDFENFGLIYNRYTDFYLQSDSSTPLKNLYNTKLNLSPNPYEYFLLADKQRLLDWYQQTEITKPESLLPIYDLGVADKDFIWQQRKHLFIKPKNSFGSKQAYKAASMSRKMFDEVYGPNFIAQKFSSPSEVEVSLNNKFEKFKYDLRCYVYKNELQLIVARLYQGQTTNLKTLGGGFAAIKIN